MAPHLLLHGRLINLLVARLLTVDTMTYSVQVVGTVVLHVELLLGRGLLVSHHVSLRLTTAPIGHLEGRLWRPRQLSEVLIMHRRVH